MLLVAQKRNRVRLPQLLDVKFVGRVVNRRQAGVNPPIDRIVAGLDSRDLHSVPVDRKLDGTLFEQVLVRPAEGDQLIADDLFKFFRFERHSSPSPGGST